MRLRVFLSAAGLLLLLVATTGVKGCREEAARTFNPNRPPETYLTAAPVESTTVSYLYHVHWTGSDPDGEVVGYFIAVTDSNIEPQADSLVWTTDSDTSIAFRVAGKSQTLTHRFYVTSVDNEGRADPTPAWVFFEAYDAWYPEPLLTKSYAVGNFYGRRTTFQLTDNYAIDGIRDTVPAGADTVRFEWTGRDRDRFGKVMGYRFRISGDAGYTDVGPDFTGKTYSGLPSGPIYFNLVAIDDAGAQTDPDSTRVFVSNFDPDTRFDPTFIERRPAGKETLTIYHNQWDTVAVGSKVIFQVHGGDPDGDSSKLQYSHTLVTQKECGGGSVPAFSFFDEVNTGPTYTYADILPSNPAQCGTHRAWARTRDELGRNDGTRAEFYFYSNLPPQFGAGDVLVDGLPLSEHGSFQVADTIVVAVAGAVDPDPGSGSGGLRVGCRLDGVDVSYVGVTNWLEFGTDMVLRGIPQAGSYKYQLTVQVMDEGCRAGKLVKEIILSPK